MSPPPGQGLPGIDSALRITGADTAQKVSQEKAFVTIAKLFSASSEFMQKIDPAAMSLARNLDISAIKGPIAMDTNMPSFFSKKGR